MNRNEVYYRIKRMIIVILVFMIVISFVGCTPVIPEPCAELAQLKVIYNGRYLTPDEVIEIPNNTKVLFEVQGLDITGELDACLDGSVITWEAG